MHHQDFKVGWICAALTELVAARALLDQEYPLLPTHPNDHNTYTLGRIGCHNIVIACLGVGRYGTASAASAAKDMLRSFECIRIGLMVGIGGGAPTDKHDIRLGDVVVGCPMNGQGGVVPYNFGKVIQGREFQLSGFLNSPPTALLTAAMALSADHKLHGNHIAESVQKINKNQEVGEGYQHPGVEHDMLYESDYTHRGGDGKCEDGCGIASPPVLQRRQRNLDPNEPVVHYGLIASADMVMKDAITRDRLVKKHEILCFEMEAAGLMNNFPCIVIRGIYNYSDSHKNEAWRGYAAATAASYAKELLCRIPDQSVHMQTAAIAPVEISEQTLAMLTEFLLEKSRSETPGQSLATRERALDDDTETDSALFDR